VADATQRNATITAIDPERRRVTLQFQDGTAKSFEVRKDARLAGVNTGDAVVVRTTAAVVISLENP
jgi:Cu/Ag efflux protein CusF